MVHQAMHPALLSVALLALLQLCWSRPVIPPTQFDFAAVKDKASALLLSQQLLKQLETPATTKALFTQWANLNKRDYKPNSKLGKKRQKNFVANIRKIAAINADDSKGWWSGPNIYSDLSDLEFKKQILNLVPPSPADETPGSDDPAQELPGGIPKGLLNDTSAAGRHLLGTFYPDDVDWRTSGKVTPVKNQGGCGSCWAFAAVAAIESAYLIRNGPQTCGNLDLSEQQMVSCVTSARGYSSKGCSGGHSNEAINYAYKNQLVRERWFPYTGTDSPCNLPIVPASDAMSLAWDYKKVSPANTEQLLKYWVADRPIVIYFSVDDQFRHYAGGIFKPTTCSNTINHAMLAVGYHTSGSGDDYWIIKNSWGTSFGESGFIRVKMSNGFPLFDSGPCGMYKYAYVASIYQDDLLSSSSCTSPPPPPRSPPPPFTIKKPPPPKRFNPCDPDFDLASDKLGSKVARCPDPIHRP